MFKRVAVIPLTKTHLNPLPCWHSPSPSTCVWHEVCWAECVFSSRLLHPSSPVPMQAVFPFLRLRVSSECLLSTFVSSVNETAMSNIHIIHYHIIQETKKKIWKLQTGLHKWHTDDDVDRDSSISRIDSSIRRNLFSNTSCLAFNSVLSFSFLMAAERSERKFCTRK